MTDALLRIATIGACSRRRAEGESPSERSRESLLLCSLVTGERRSCTLRSLSGVARSSPRLTATSSHASSTGVPQGIPAERKRSACPQHIA